MKALWEREGNSDLFCSPQPHQAGRKAALYDRDVIVTSLDYCAPDHPYLKATDSSTPLVDCPNRWSFDESHFENTMLKLVM